MDASSLNRQNSYRLKSFCRKVMILPTNEKNIEFRENSSVSGCFSSAGVRYERFGSIVGDLLSVTDRAVHSCSVEINFRVGNKRKQIVQ